MAFSDELKLKTAYANEVLSKYLPVDQGMFGGIEEPVSYSVTAGGKRLRPILLSEAFRLFDADENHRRLLAEPFMCALEFIHTYSLVHDDLPAMDNDMLRRGKPTTHAKYGEDMGILAGDGLLNLAFETMSAVSEGIEYYAPDEVFVLSSRALKAVNLIAVRSGIYGMIGGQVYDLAGEKMDMSSMTLEEQEAYILRTYELKTSCLIEAGLTAGAQLAGADRSAITLLSEYGKYLGIAFQIRDDILDVIGDERLGKDIGSDEKNDKLTWMKLHGIEESKKTVEEYSAKCHVILDELSNIPGCSSVDFLKELTDYLINREY